MLLLRLPLSIFEFSCPNISQQGSVHVFILLVVSTRVRHLSAEIKMSSFGHSYWMFGQTFNILHIALSGIQSRTSLREYMFRINVCQPDSHPSRKKQWRNHWVDTFWNKNLFYFCSIFSAPLPLYIISINLLMLGLFDRMNMVCVRTSTIWIYKYQILQIKA